MTVRGTTRRLPPLVTFDAGQVLVELDLDFLGRRLAERGHVVAPGALHAAAPAAWRAFDALLETGVPSGDAHATPWHTLVAALLTGAGIADPAPTVAWLWSEQPRANLFRRPITGMVDLARELAAAGATVAVLSNSEGRLAELLTELAIADPFVAIHDSGRLGFEKPDRRMFDHARGDHPAASAIHIGDSWTADVEGAIAAGWRAVWYGRRAHPVADPRIACATDPEAARDALIRWRALPG